MSLARSYGASGGSQFQAGRGYGLWRQSGPAAKALSSLLADPGLAGRHWLVDAKVGPWCAWANRL